MNRMLLSALASIGLFLSSCAYVQTHKNVEEIGSHFDGHLLSKDTIALCRSGNRWYLTAQRAQFKKRYPVVHDSVFRKYDSDPHFELISSGKETYYHPISSATADILQRSNGFYELSALASEIENTPGEWTNALSSAQFYPIRAEISGAPRQQMSETRVPAAKPLASRALGKLDFVLIDVPSTLAYNVAIPFMAPFVFFHEFLSEDKE